LTATVNGIKHFLITDAIVNSARAFVSDNEKGFYNIDTYCQ